MENPTEELEESELGSKEYWDSTYKEDLLDYKRSKDVGVIWFGEDIVQRITSWITKNIQDKSVKIMDLGCGNGMLSVELFKLDYMNITAVDYSEDAINLAKEIAKNEDCTITYKLADILNVNPGDWSVFSNLDLVLDKGTYDAISLMSNSQVTRKTYIENVYAAMNTETGRFILTSCNWTENELCQQLKTHFELVHVIPTPQFKFGGVVGNVVSSVVFKCKLLL